MKHTFSRRFAPERFDPSSERTTPPETLDTNNYQVKILDPIKTPYIIISFYPAIIKELRSLFKESGIGVAGQSSFMAAILRRQIGRSFSS
jgi:hypothetical protein